MFPLSVSLVSPRKRIMLSAMSSVVSRGQPRAMAGSRRVRPSSPMPTTPQSPAYVLPWMGRQQVPPGHELRTQTQTAASQLKRLLFCGDLRACRG